MSMVVLPQVFARERRESLSLLLVDRGFSRHEIPAATRFDLDKAEDVFVPSDQVNVAATAGRAEVSGDNNESEFAQIEEGFIFAAGAEGKVGSSRGRPAEGGNDSIKRTQSGAKDHWDLYFIAVVRSSRDPKLDGQFDAYRPSTWLMHFSSTFRA